MSKAKLTKEAIEELRQVIKSLKGFSGRKKSPVKYNKNIVQDELANTPGVTGKGEGFVLKGKPESKDFTMPAEGAQVPAIRQSTEAVLVPGQAKKQSMDLIPSMSKADDIVETTAKSVPMLPAPAASAPVGRSMLQKLMMGGAAAGGLGLGAMGLMEDEQEAPVQIPFRREEKPQVQQPEEQSMLDEMDAGAQDEALDQVGVTEQEQKKEIAQQLKNEQDYLKLMREAQQDDIDQNFINTMLRAGIQAGSALSMTNADYSGVDALEKQAGRSVANVKTTMDTDMAQKKLQAAQRELDDEAALRNPQSTISKQLRELLSKAGYPTTEDVSAKNLKDMGVNVYNLLAQKQQQDATIKAAELKEGKSKQSFIAGAQKVLLKPFQEFQKVNSAFNSVQQFVNNKPSGPQDVAILYDFIKTLDPGSVVREGEIALTRQGMSLFEGLGLKVNKITSGELLNDNFRRSVLEIGRQKRDQAEANYREISKPFIVNAASMGMSEDDMGKFDYMAGVQAPQASQQVFSAKQEAGINAYMQSKNISREEAISRLKAAKRL